MFDSVEENREKDERYAPYDKINYSSMEEDENKIKGYVPYEGMI